MTSSGMSQGVAEYNLDDDDDDDDDTVANDVLMVLNCCVSGEFGLVWIVNAAADEAASNVAAATIHFAILYYNNLLPVEEKDKNMYYNMWKFTSQARIEKVTGHWGDGCYYLYLSYNISD